MQCLSQCLLQFLETAQGKTPVGKITHTRSNWRNLPLAQRRRRLQKNEDISSTTAYQFESAYCPQIHESFPHKIFPDLLQRDFTTEGKNKKWATDFTYLYTADGSLHYNCTIIDLYDRSVVSSLTDSKMTASLAIRTLKDALRRQPKKISGLILHSDQGSQFTSREFTSFCSSVGIIQSMSKAGCPYDNSPMERFFNTLKTEFIYLFEFHSKEQLYKSVEEFAYVFYNHVRPHSFNDYMTPFQKRYF